MADYKYARESLMDQMLKVYPHVLVQSKHGTGKSRAILAAASKTLQFAKDANADHPVIVIVRRRSEYKGTTRHGGPNTLPASISENGCIPGIVNLDWSYAGTLIQCHPSKLGETMTEVYARIAMDQELNGRYAAKFPQIHIFCDDLDQYTNDEQYQVIWSAEQRPGELGIRHCVRFVGTHTRETSEKMQRFFLRLLNHRGGHGNPEVEYAHVSHPAAASSSSSPASVNSVGDDVDLDMDF